MSERMKEDFYLAGKILKPKGLRGEVKILPVTDFPDSYLERKIFYVGKSEEDAVRRAVRQAALRKGFAYLLFSDIDSREKAEAIVGYSVFVRSDALIQLPPDRAYLHELRGLKVFNERHEELGIIEDVLGMPAHDVYEIRCGGRVVYVPAVEEFVEEISIDEGYMVLKRFEEFL